MIISRIFYGLRQVYTLRVKKIKLTPISENRAKALLKKYLPQVKLTVGESDDDRLETYSDFEAKIIHLDTDDLFEEILLHEIGHSINIPIKGTKNNLFHYSDTFSRQSYMDMEEEAWDWAEKNSSKPWGPDQLLYKRACLDGYRAIKTSDLPV